ncbi:MAG: tetratricopeptide repeat protein [Nitrospirae bacterium]|nr:tetratricopeptide repeat protein [Nitrospirota bacterium]
MQALQKNNELICAVQYLEKAHELQPDNADVLVNLGSLHLQLGYLRAAESNLRKALQIKPDEASAYSLLGNVLKRLGKFADAVASHKQAVSLMPSSAEMRSNLASAYLSLDKIDFAIEEYRKAVSMQPDSAELHFNLATALQKGERYEEACSSFETALKLNPGHARANMNFGASLRALGKPGEAIVYLRRATGIEPDYADAHWNLALALLMSGDYHSGWKEYEWRLKIPDIPIRKFSQPLWDGSVQPDKTLLIHAEQGMGDTIQFVRFATIARTRVGRIILYCHPPLRRLLSNVQGVDKIVTAGQPLPEFDIQLPLLSLPGVLEITLENIPRMPYLHAAGSLKDKWHSRLSSNKFKVGLVWAGNPIHKDDHNRSCKLSDFTRLLKTPEVIFYSLQRENADASSIGRPEELNLIDTGAELTDFADTAALIANLDLVISVDTAAAHLAGALGRSVWILIPFAPDWRWMLARADTPWYPSMRIFRQSRAGDWEGVMASVEEALKELKELKS